jgi:hypothetical protein
MIPKTQIQAGNRKYKKGARSIIFTAGIGRETPYLYVMEHVSEHKVSRLSYPDEIPV